MPRNAPGKKRAYTYELVQAVAQHEKRIVEVRRRRGSWSFVVHLVERQCTRL
jgi:hypothetical protein